MSTAKIVYTITDEAPALATYSLLPIVQGFTRAAGVTVETRDISLAGRILAAFPEHITPGQRQSDDLAELGELAKTPEANIIKLPNISASIPQLKAAIKELQHQGYAVPDYPEDPQDDAGKAVKARYAKVLGSAVNPVLREGNSDRRVATSVKEYARSHPHSMGTWSPDSKSHVSSMSGGDFYANEQAAVIGAAGTLAIEFTDATTGGSSVLKEVSVGAGDVIAASMMSRAALQDFYAAQIADAKARGVLLSLHLKATMMKVSDPIMFGHAVVAYYKDVFDKHAAVFARLGVDPDNGIGDVYAKIQALPADQKAAIEADIQAGVRDAAAAGDGRLEQGHHQPARAERRHHRRVDAGRGPRLGPDVGARRQAARHEGDDPGSLLCRHLPGDDRRLQGARRLRRADDGHRVERRADGAGGRGIRLARQDVRDRHGRHHAGDRSQRRNAHRAQRGARRHLAHVPHARPADSRLGEAGGDPRPRHRPRRHFLARRHARLRPARHRQDPAVPRHARHDRPRHPHPAAGRGHHRHARARAPGRQHHLRHRQRAARLPHRSVPDPRARHQREDAVDRAASGRRRALRDRGRGVGAETRAAAAAGELPALGLARRVPGPGRVDRGPRSQDRQPAGGGRGRGARPRQRTDPRARQVAAAEGGRDRQPRQPLLPGALLGARAGRADEGSGAAGDVHAASRSSSSATKR